jgi:ATP-binding cassette subfamily C protein LapB
MDAQSEVAFLRQLKASAGTCTLVMVTHRPAVLELVDRVVVIDAGRIVMDGPKFLGLITRIDFLNYLRRKVQ